MPNQPDGDRLDSIALRAVRDEDVDFLRDVYARTRVEELTRSGTINRPAEVLRITTRGAAQGVSDAESAEKLQSKCEGLD